MKASWECMYDPKEPNLYVSPNVDSTMTSNNAVATINTVVPPLSCISKFSNEEICHVDTSSWESTWSTWWFFGKNSSFRSRELSLISRTGRTGYSANLVHGSCLKLQKVRGLRVWQKSPCRRVKKRIPRGKRVLDYQLKVTDPQRFWVVNLFKNYERSSTENDIWLSHMWLYTGASIWVF